MKALVVLLLLASLVAATECFTVGDDIEMEELGGRLVDAVTCGLSGFSNISPSAIATLLIVVVILLIFYGFVRALT